MADDIEQFEEARLFIEGWEQNFARRCADPEHDRALFARRQEHFGEGVSLRQYQSFMAFAEEFGIMTLNGMSEDEGHLILRHTVGTQHEGLTDEEIVRTLDGYLEAAGRVYDAEVSAALRDFRI